MDIFEWEDGTVTEAPYVLINGTKHYVQSGSVSGGTPVSSTNLNAMQGILNQNILDEFNEREMLLWTNSNPNTAMSTQDITLPSNDYDVLEIFYKSAYNQNTIKTVKMIKNYNTIMTSYSVNFSSTSYFMRALSYVDATTLTVGSGYSLNPTSKTQNDGVCIPLYIVGYKTGLFS